MKCFSCKRAILFITCVAILLLYLSRPTFLHIANGYTFEYKKEADGLVAQGTCSLKSDLRGGGQRVVSYSVYPNWNTGIVDEKYTRLLSMNAETVQQVYPGWVIRIYHNLTVSQLIQHKILRDISTLPHVDLCNVSRVLLKRNQTIRYPRTWRYLPVVDNNVDYFLSRDSDSPILQREVDAVAEWIDSNVTYHSMRDHPNHCLPYLAGLWGARLVQPAERASVQRAMTEILSRQDSYIGDDESADQNLLTRYLWLPYRKNTLSHDSYCCSNFASSRPFPTRRNGSYFVGMVIDPANRNPPAAMDSCPEECRSKNHQDWLHC